MFTVSCLGGELLSARHRTAQELFKTSSTADQSTILVVSLAHGTYMVPDCDVSPSLLTPITNFANFANYSPDHRELPYSPTDIYTVCIHIHPTANPSHPSPTFRTRPTQPPTSTPTYTSPKGLIEPYRFLTNAPDIHLAASHSQHQVRVRGYSYSVGKMTITIGGIWR